MPPSKAEPRPKCLLIHGNPRSRLDWEPLIPHLSEFADVAALDLPGFGGSPRTTSSPDSVCLDRLAEHVLAAADALGWHAPAVLIGHSHGGGVAQTIAARFPERVAGLVLIGTLGAPAQLSYRLLNLPGAATLARRVGSMLRSERLRPLCRAVLRRVLHDIYAPAKLSEDKVEEELSLLAAHPETLLSMVHVTLGDPCEQLLSAADEIRCPTLFIHGEKDALVPPRCALSIHQRILQAGGRSQFQSIPDGGHMLMHSHARELAGYIFRLIS